jgi:hypothetical protein
VDEYNWDWCERQNIVKNLLGILCSSWSFFACCTGQQSDSSPGGRHLTDAPDLRARSCSHHAPSADEGSLKQVTETVFILVYAPDCQSDIAAKPIRPMKHSALPRISTMPRRPRTKATDRQERIGTTGARTGESIKCACCGSH